MKTKIKELSIQVAALLIHTNILIHELRIQNYNSALQRIETVSASIEKLILLTSELNNYLQDRNINFDQKLLLSIIEELFDAQLRKDYILLADVYEIQLVPFLYQYQEAILAENEIYLDSDIYQGNLDEIRKKDAELADILLECPDPKDLLNNGYIIEPTSSGVPTLALNKSGVKKYFHSNINALWEAYQLAREWYSEDVNNYIICGLGFGYHAWQLSSFSEYINIEIYENDINIIQLVCAYQYSNSFLRVPNIKIIYDPDFTKLASRIEIKNRNEAFYIHFPSLQNIGNEKIKNQLENYFYQQASIKNQLRFLNGNFDVNIQHYDGFVDDLEEKFKGKNLYIIAAGPSLDKNYMQLKSVKDGIILATGTVYKKLMNAGIIPDYFLVTDANQKVINQIGGNENSGVPMLYISTAYKGFAEQYNGKKYIVCQKDYDKAETFAKAHDKQLYQTGGSVSTTALDIGINLGCKRIIFLGLDLAYTNNYIHASDTSLRELNDTEGLRKVEDINGNMVYTGKNLDSFRIWIENRIREVAGIEFIDATEGGAKIAGMKIKEMKDCISFD